MIRATTTAGSCENPADTITLDADARHRRRVSMTTDNGVRFLLDLPRAQRLRHGEALLLDDGRTVEVCAASEPLMEVRGRGPRHLLALAWQIGNRHLPAQIEANRLLLRRDAVVREMLEGLGAELREIEAPFEPEGGAYGGHGHHDHG